MSTLNNLKLVAAYLVENGRKVDHQECHIMIHNVR